MTGHDTPPQTYAVAPQDSVDLYAAAASLLRAEWTLIDFDDTLVQHDPEAQYWLALHTLATSHGGKDQFPADGFRAHYQNGPDHPHTLDYLNQVREVSRYFAGDPDHFEKVADAFRLPANNGGLLKQAIKTLPGYPSSGRFWRARARLIADSEIPPTFGKRLMPGMGQLVLRLQTLGKHLGIISNSRDDMVLPAMRALFPQENRTFRLILALGGSDLPLKPDPAAFQTIQKEYDIPEQETVYIGNADEDAAFAAAIGSTAIILGPPFATERPAHFVADPRRLNRVVRLHTEGARLARIITRNPQSPLQTPDRLTMPTEPRQVTTNVRRGLQDLWARHLTQTVQALTSDVWGQDCVSLRSVENFCEYFGGIMGEIRLAERSRHPLLDSYYTPERLDVHKNFVSLRGPSYFAAADDRFRTSAEQAAFMKDELVEALTTAAAIDITRLTAEDLLPYAGVLDNAKQQALALFHAFIHQERRQGTPEDSAYLQKRQHLLNIAVAVTRTFYEICIGQHPTGVLRPAAIEQALTKLLPDLAQVPRAAFKIQELDHPLRILLSAHNLSEVTADTVIGFPSGGTQVAIATALAIERRHGLAPGKVTVLSVPLSQHSGTLKTGAQPISDQDLARSVALYRDHITHQRILIVDDNSSTGTTLRRGSEATKALAPRSIRSGVCEIDPQRLLLRARMAAAGASVPDSVNLEHPSFASAVGIVPVTRGDIQLRKRHTQQVLRNRGGKRQ